MTNGEAINWLINLTADIGKIENQNLWHYEQALAEIRGMLESAPRWIPCSEQLPRDNEAVNIVWVNRSPAIYYQAIKDKPETATGVYYRGQWYWWSAVVQDYLAEYGEWDCDKMDKAIEVTHWQPLPEPTEEEKT